jgi:hypothetical protein
MGWQRNYPWAVMGVGIHPEAIEGEAFALLSVQIAEDVDRYADILPDLPYLQTKTNWGHFDYFRAPTMRDSVPAFLRHVVGT